MDKQQDKNKMTQCNAIRIKLASPETIRKWSFGEVTKPETINYRTFKPERDGLFCERIFGPVKDWECNCGKYKRIRYRGVICDRCGVEVTQTKVRRERLGHIELAVPVCHIWYFKSPPSRIGNLLNMSIRNLERVIYYESYVVIDPGTTDLKSGDLLDQDTYLDLEDAGQEFTAEMGAGALRRLLAEIDIDELSAELRAQVKVETSVQRKNDALKRLKVVEAFRNSSNRPEWMIMEALPVIPPDLRPLVPLEGGRFATSDLNDLYRRVINRNNRLKKLIEIKAPDVILRNEKRMLQEAVDALLDNGRRSRAVRGDGNRSLKSLSDLLKGKQGRFRQNLLGKRVDYSGRSVIVVAPELQIHQCGLPKNMALELFKPFIIQRLEDKGYVQTVKSAKKLVERERPEVWDILEEIIKDHPVLLNRAPTLHRLGIQAFMPVLVEGKAIRIHPLVCEAFNADFDGDQMAVHVPMSFEAQIEARVLMLSSNNIMDPKNGHPLCAPSKDIVLGCYYLTKERSGCKGEGKIFSSADEVRLAHDNGEVELHSRVKVRLNGKRIETTPGRVIFNEIVPGEIDYVNEVLDNKAIRRLVGAIYRRLGNYQTCLVLDEIKRLGFRYATLSGLTAGIDDVVIPEEKAGLIHEAESEVAEIRRQYEGGAITEGERYNKVIDVWQHTRTTLNEIVQDTLKTSDEGFNPFYMMMASGARSKLDQVGQLCGMRGLMAKPQRKVVGQVGEYIETPILSNFKEGLTVLEYFISSHGGRKGLADTALKTADAGYLTRRLVDVAQDVIITEQDCKTTRGIDIFALKEGENVMESLGDRVLGRVVREDIYDPITRDLLVSAGEEITEDVAATIEERTGVQYSDAPNAEVVEYVSIRSVLTCEARRGVCAKCYGRNLATGKLVEIGEAVGVMAAQSIGEPGTQLTLRTFHIGGIASRDAAQNKITTKKGGKVVFTNMEIIQRRDGSSIVVGRSGEIAVMDPKGNRLAHMFVPYGAVLLSEDQITVEENHALFEWNPYNNPIIAVHDGYLKMVDVVPGETLREQLDDTTGMRQHVITENRGSQALNPRVFIVDEKGKELGEYNLPTGAHLLVHEYEENDRSKRKHVLPGDVLARLPRSIGRTRDITGGLPRVAELFEARRPRDPAVVAEIDGVVHIGGVLRRARRVVVRADDGSEREYQIPQGRHMSIRDGDRVQAGEPLSEGSIDPHDILKIKGVNAVQEYLVNQIQEVYRMQGVSIDDKHVEVIVRQMLQKVRVDDPGDTEFLKGEPVDKRRFQEENDRVIQEGADPATEQPLLLGITKASLSTESFVSAAAFQETTRVLTEAAIQGKKDELLGLKENVIMGHLIPAGTGIERYRQIQLLDDEGNEIEERLPPEPTPIVLELSRTTIVESEQDS
ncbi:MAG: DNA-directed RNA polymerase subunit beta' [candidate division Zixibacteria bacterium]|nr:DNA-directed RNA polymerase subunit beta' [candidate division Zixibacteria bacterium]